MATATNSTMIEREKKQIEKMKAKQVILIMRFLNKKGKRDQDYVRI
jgi:hypothetical protein